VDYVAQISDGGMSPIGKRGFPTLDELLYKPQLIHYLAVELGGGLHGVSKDRSRVLSTDHRELAGETDEGLRFLFGPNARRPDLTHSVGNIGNKPLVKARNRG
jgi:hypothetical protein